MAVKSKGTVLFKCLRCKNSLERFKPSNAFAALGRTGTRYKCPHCHLLYDSKGPVSLTYKVFMVGGMLSLLIALGASGGNEPFQLHHLIISLILPAIYLYFYGTFRPLTPILYKFKDRI
ncbi:MAG: hypothetical protein MK185_02455 [Saccharospirillaceae bacterium]|nr:hypothetical protein [Saccharospirillaceae bacterium]